MANIVVRILWFLPLVAFIMIGFQNEVMSQNNFPSGQSYGSPPPQQGYGQYPSQGGYSGSPRGGQYQPQGQQPGNPYGTPPPQQGYGQYPSQGGYYGSPANAARPPNSGIPGVDLSGLNQQQVEGIYARLQAENCSCGCGYNTLQCRIQDPSCTVSLNRAQQLVSSVRASGGGGAPSGYQRPGYSPQYSPGSPPPAGYPAQSPYR